MRRHLAWSSLIALLLVVACGPTTVTDINNGASDDDDDIATGDDDDDGGTGTVTPTPSGTGAQPTLTNVPSFATWQAQIKPLASCASQCHGGSPGGFFFDGAAANDKFSWFTSICNRDSGALNEGIQSYSPPTGRWRDYMANQVVSHAAINANQTTINNWFAQGGTTVPPDCNTYYDLANSN